MLEELDNISVVLVETLQAGNIGSTARAMKNMGLRRLKLVRPAQPLNPQCRMMAAGALDVVEAAQTFSSLDEALADEHLVVGTTSHRERKPRQPLKSPRQLAPSIRKQAQSHRVALVFGSERGGLDDQTLSRCRYLASIPASPDHPVLNVAQSVMVLAYEIFTAQPEDSVSRPGLATDRQREQMFQHVEKALTQIGFFAADNQEHLMKSIRNLLIPDLSRRDIRIVRGIMSQIEWYAKEGHRTLSGNRRPETGDRVRAAGGGDEGK